MIEWAGAPLWLSLCVLAGFLLDWAAVAFSWSRIKPLTKVLAMLLVILWTLAAFNFEIGWLPGMLIAAQVFGLLGDFFLLYPNRWFMRGLGAFLLGHLFYSLLLLLLLVNGIQTGWMSDLTLKIVIPGILLWALIMVIFNRIFAPHIRTGGAGGAFWRAILFYAWTLSGLTLLTVFFVILVPGHSLSQWFLPVGGILFYISDFLLAYDRFVRRISQGQLWIHMTYHLAQFSLAIGIVQFL